MPAKCELMLKSSFWRIVQLLVAAAYFNFPAVAHAEVTKSHQLQTLKQEVMNGNYERALGLADILLKTEGLPTETAVSALGLKATANKKLGNYEEALSNRSSALALSPNDFWLLMSSCQEYAQAGFLEKASRDCDRARWVIRRIADPKLALQAKQYLNYSEARLAQINGEIDLALKLVELIEKDGGPVFDRWYLDQLKGELLSSTGQYERAISAFDSALERENGLNIHQINKSKFSRALVYLYEGQTKRATDEIQKIIKNERLHGEDTTDLSNIDYAYALCAISVEYELVDEAQVACEMAAKIEPYNSAVLEQLGNAQVISGNTEAGIQTYHQVLKLDPGNSYVQQRLKTLTK